MNRMICCLLLLGVLVTLGSCQWTGDYLGLGKPCDPNPTRDRCFPGSKCNRRTRICDCQDSSDGQWKRTFENKECRLLPGSRCVQNVDQDFYRCVENSKCTVTRVGQDPRKCPQDAPCDTGDYACVCPPGQKCLTRKFSATPL